MSVGLRHKEKRYPLAFALTILLFAIWGGAHRIFGIVSPQFETFFAYGYVQSTIIFISLNASYVLVAIPVALFLRRFGYKLGLVSGLGAFAVGALLLYPAVTGHQVLFYSTAVVVTGIGWAFLEVSANTLIVRMGPSETAVRRLNLAQCFYPAGLIVAAMFGQHLIPPPHDAVSGQFVNVVVRPYVTLGLCMLLLAIVIENVEFPNVAAERTPRSLSPIDDINALWARPQFRAGAAALAVFTAGLACLWGCTSRYAHHVLPVAPVYGWTIFSMATWWLCVIGRVFGTGLMIRIEPMRLLAAFAAFATVLCVFPAVSDGVYGLGAMLAASFFISIMFPTIFAETIRDLGAHTKMGAGIMVAASGLGGLVGTAAQRVLAGYTGFVHVSLMIAALCFAAVLLFAVAALVRRAAESPESSLGLPAGLS